MLQIIARGATENQAQESLLEYWQSHSLTTKKPTDRDWSVLDLPFLALATSRKRPASSRYSLLELQTFLGQSGLVWRR
jgi:hypothetical protein